MNLKSKHSLRYHGFGLTICSYVDQRGYSDQNQEELGVHLVGKFSNWKFSTGSRNIKGALINEVLVLLTFLKACFVSSAAYLKTSDLCIKLLDRERHCGTQPFCT